jgi:hypothetical protein
MPGRGKELASRIERNRASCALSWRALKRIVADPAGRQQIEAALDAVLRDHPERAVGVRAQKAQVAAAAGQPEEMLAIADADVRDHPEDKSFPDMSCFVRGRHGFDIAGAMAFCNAAVDGEGRPGYALVNRARVELAPGKWEEAGSDFNEALGNQQVRAMSHPMLVDAVYGRGIARLRLGDAGGKQDIKDALAVRDSIARDSEDAGLRP